MADGTGHELMDDGGILISDTVLRRSGDTAGRGKGRPEWSRPPLALDPPAPECPRLRAPEDGATSGLKASGRVSDGRRFMVRLFGIEDLVGCELSAVCFVGDYVEFHFDGPVL
jgi:hypothetical protein